MLIRSSGSSMKFLIVFLLMISCRSFESSVRSSNIRVSTLLSNLFSSSTRTRYDWFFLSCSSACCVFVICYKGYDWFNWFYINRITRYNLVKHLLCESFACKVSIIPYFLKFKYSGVSKLVYHINYSFPII